MVHHHLYTLGAKKLFSGLSGGFFDYNQIIGGELDSTN